MFRSLEICAGAGGQALGLEQAGFCHEELIEIDEHACNTLKTNRPKWNVRRQDLRDASASHLYGIDLFAGGVPCPPFSLAGKQLGEKDERDLFPEALRLIAECKPKAVMLENVRGLLGTIFDEYRAMLKKNLEKLGYVPDWRLVNASDFGVPQLRPRVIFVALQKDIAPFFRWPHPDMVLPPTVGYCLKDLMSEGGWRGADLWSKRANDIGPTLVGGSKKHGGADLGPSRARRAWASLGVDGRSLANEPPARDFVGMPRLTLRMTARIQGFPDSWKFTGGKTAAYRQIGNALPPPVAASVATQISEALQKAASRDRKRA
jgi:DNA (cytosine-5)-methyltransferase 1